MYFEVTSVYYRYGTSHSDIEYTILTIIDNNILNIQLNVKI